MECPAPGHCREIFGGFGRLACAAAGDGPGQRPRLPRLRDSDGTAGRTSGVFGGSGCAYYYLLPSAVAFAEGLRGTWMEGRGLSGGGTGVARDTAVADVSGIGRCPGRARGQRGARILPRIGECGKQTAASRGCD